MHVPRGRNTASLLLFEEVLGTCGYFDENPYFLPYLEMASKACQGLVHSAGASIHRMTLSAQRYCYRDLDSLAYRSCATRDQIQGSQGFRLPLEDSLYSRFGCAEHRVGLYCFGQCVAVLLPHFLSDQKMTGCATYCSWVRMLEMKQG